MQILIKMTETISDVSGSYLRGHEYFVDRDFATGLIVAGRAEPLTTNFASIEHVETPEEAADPLKWERFPADVVNYPLWSILIATIPSRAHYLERLLDVLTPQLMPEVEVLVLSDTTRTIGCKRNYLLDEAAGEFICYIDDDDLVAPNYVEKIVEALQDTAVDAVGFWVNRSIDGKPDKPAKHSQDYRLNSETRRFYKRPINHLNPVLRFLAQDVRFRNISCGEDTDYAHRLYPLLGQTAFIDEPLYEYEFRTKK